MDIAAPSWSLWLKLFLLMGMGAYLLIALTRRVARDPLLTGIVLGTFGLRVSLTFAMFFISLWNLPILHAQQYAQGFWVFSVDSTTYHLYGAAIANAWEKGFELPDPQLNLTYFFVVALLYKLLGAHPLYPALFNCLLTSLMAILAYGIGRRLFSHQAGVISAGLIGFWPSSLLWSTQLLKDSLSWLLCFSALWLLLTLVSDAPSLRRFGAVRTVFHYMLLSGVVSVLTLLRPYMGSLLSVVAAVIFVPVSGLALMRRRIGHGVQGLVIALVVLGSSLTARTWDLFHWLSPPHPDEAHYRVAVQYAHEGQWSRALGEFARAVQLNNAYTEASYGLSATSIGLGNAQAAQGDYENAIHSYSDAVRSCTHLLEREQDPQSQSFLRETIGRLYFEIAVCWLMQGRPDDAQGVYDLALSFYPALPSQFGDLRLILRDDWKGLPSPLLPKSVMTPSDRTQQSNRLVEQLPPVAVLDGSQAEQPPRAESLVEGVTRLDEEALLAASEITAGSSPSQPPPPRIQGIVESVSRLNDEAFLAASEITAESLDARRQGFVVSGGYSLMDAGVTISTLKSLIRYLPRALLICFLAPFPSQWFDTRGSTGIMRTLASADVLLIYLLLPAMLLGIVAVARRRRPDGILLLAFVFIVAIPMSLVVANLGSLYRLRLQFILPLLVLAAGGLSPFWRALVGVRAGSPRAGPTAPAGVATDLVATPPVAAADAAREAAYP